MSAVQRVCEKHRVSTRRKRLLRAASIPDLSPRMTTDALGEEIGGGGGGGGDRGGV